MIDENKIETNFIKAFIDSKNKGTPMNVEWSCVSWGEVMEKMGMVEVGEWGLRLGLEYGWRCGIFVEG